MSVFVLSVISALQKVQFFYLYLILGIYFVLLWIAYAIWVWNDTEKRFSNRFVQALVWVVVTVTFIPGLFLYLLIRPQEESDDIYWLGLEKQYLRYQTFGTEKCFVCQYPLRPDFMQCPSCGNKVRELCPKCNHMNELTWRKCPYCGRVRIEEKKEEKLNKQKKQSNTLHKFLSYFQLGYKNTLQYVMRQSAKIKPKPGKKQTRKPSLLWEKIKRSFVVEEDHIKKTS